ncbi:MAG TPA: HEAT repeat domain-containing protein [Ktedonobacteraceae bacterium]|nr:HEAT repeat domain-containing protein [Ktedonobacteraceae bacterium]
METLQDKHWQVREATVLALGQLMPHLTQQQREQLEDLESMAELRMPIDERLLNRFLHHEDESVRAAASMLYEALHSHSEREAI